MNKNRTNVFIGVLTGALVGFVFGAAFGSPEARLDTHADNETGDVTSLPTILSRLNSSKQNGTIIQKDEAAMKTAGDSLKFIGKDRNGNDIDIIIVNK